MACTLEVGRLPTERSLRDTGGQLWKLMHCMSCQQFAPNIHQPAAPLQPLKCPWPFAQWGLDIVGQLTTAPGGFKFLITATDYFTKWVEAKPLVTIEDSGVKHFGWRNIVSRFGAPHAIIVANGTQFVGNVFLAFCEEYGILL